MKKTERKPNRTSRNSGGPKTYGYARVSSRDQNLARQLDAMAAFGIEDAAIYADKATGGDFERPAWLRLRSRLRAEDTLVIKSIDRLGRNYDEILANWRALTEADVAIVVLDMPLLDTRKRNDNDLTGKLIADIVLQVLSYAAQLERDSIRQRQAEGIAAAHRRGVRFGRPRKELPDSYRKVCRDYLEERLTKRQAAERLGVSRNTFTRWLEEDGR